MLALPPSLSLLSLASILPLRPLALLIRHPGLALCLSRLARRNDSKRWRFILPQRWGTQNFPRPVTGAGVMTRYALNDFLASTPLLVMNCTW